MSENVLLAFLALWNIISSLPCFLLEMIRNVTSCMHTLLLLESERASEMLLDINWIHCLFSLSWGLFLLFGIKTDHNFQYLTSCAWNCCWEVITCKFTHFYSPVVQYHFLFWGVLVNKLHCAEWKRSIWSSKEHGNVPLAWKSKRYHYHYGGPKDIG